MEIVDLDPRGQTKMILYVNHVDREAMPDHWNGRFLWRKGSIFEHQNYTLFYTDLFEQYKSSLLSFYEQNPFHINKYGSVLLLNLMDMEKRWSCLRWPWRIYNWAVKGCPSFSAVVPNKSVMAVDEVLRVAIEKQPKYSHQEYRIILEEAVNRLEMPSWPSIDAKIVEYEQRQIAQIEQQRQQKKEQQKQQEIAAAQAIAQAAQEQAAKEREEEEELNRPPVIIDVECSIDELGSFEELVSEPPSVEICRAICSEIIEEALVELML
eukprot:GEZU01027656.1.p1 GENE.GEZU01027656.1~~GEZU01027656.1.p1  ORF type:complete len:266 (+),score=48.35 GEZU01027656.1:1180-1977(+)